MKLILGIIALAFIQAAEAGPRVIGNGGDAVVCRTPDGAIKSAELLDFYEARILRQMNITLQPQASLQENLDLILLRIGQKDSQLLKVVNVYLEKFMTETRFLSGTELIDIPDSEHIAVPKNCQVEQLAIQSAPKFPNDPYYTINKDIWDHLDSANQAGLVMHEILYRHYLFAQKFKEDIDSIPVRYINSLIAADKLKDLSLKDYLQYVSEPLVIGSIEIDGLWVPAHTIRFQNDQLIAYCGLHLKAQSMAFHNMHLSVAIEKDAKVCIKKDLANKTTKYAFAPRGVSIQGLVGIYRVSPSLESGTDMMFIVDDSSNLLQLGGADLEISKQLYGKEKLLCDKIVFSEKQPESISCTAKSWPLNLMPDGSRMEALISSTELNFGNHIITSGSFCVQKDCDSGKPPSQMTFYKSGRLQQIQLAKDSTIFFYKGKRWGEFVAERTSDNTLAKGSLIDFYDDEKSTPKSFFIYHYIHLKGTIQIQGKEVEVAIDVDEKIELFKNGQPKVLDLRAFNLEYTKPDGSTGLAIMGYKLFFDEDGNILDSQK